MGYWRALCSFLFSGRGDASSTETLQERAQAALKKNAVWIDVRTKEEYAKEHYRAALSIPLSDLEEEIASFVVDKNTPVVLYCRSGMRSGIAKKLLEQKAYADVENLGSLNTLRSCLPKEDFFP